MAETSPPFPPQQALSHRLFFVVVFSGQNSPCRAWGSAAAINPKGWTSKGLPPPPQEAHVCFWFPTAVKPDKNPAFWTAFALCDPLCSFETPPLSSDLFVDPFWTSGSFPSRPVCQANLSPVTVSSVPD